MDWSVRSCDAGGGFLRYEKRSPGGLRNQGWKDSDEAIRHADGRIADPNLATVEEQAFHYLALQRMAEILVALDEPDRADEYLRQAQALRERWHHAFWMPDERFYALALEPDGAQVRSITSNPGHALGAGMVPTSVARRVADRLLSPAMFSGWGVRTLADDHPSYNPFAYHLGTVWPVENATFALGFKRYGLEAHVERLIDAQLEAAMASPDARLPEALTGHRREPRLGPTPYPNACSPQAWSASAVIQLIQVMLGLYPFAPLHVLSLVRPRLPAWLPEVTLRNLRVGRATVDLRFSRRKDGSASHKVLRKDGRLLIVPAGPPADLSGKPPQLTEAIGRAALERAPGRLVRAARIALGVELGVE
jgi:glycogen debranching enzyme